MPEPVHICIKCGHIWGGTRRPEDVTKEKLSGGVCGKCIIEYIREKQKNQGFDDCFMRATELCSSEECSYWALCNRTFLQELSKIVEEDLGSPRESKYG